MYYTFIYLFILFLFIYFFIPHLFTPSGCYVFCDKHPHAYTGREVCQASHSCWIVRSQWLSLCPVSILCLVNRWQSKFVSSSYVWCSNSQPDGDKICLITFHTACPFDLAENMYRMQTKHLWPYSPDRSWSLAILLSCMYCPVEAEGYKSCSPFCVDCCNKYQKWSMLHHISW